MTSNVVFLFEAKGSMLMTYNFVNLSILLKHENS
jgi:hypothetical protein